MSSKRVITAVAAAACLALVVGLEWKAAPHMRFSFRSHSDTTQTEVDIGLGDDKASSKDLESEPVVGAKTLLHTAAAGGNLGAVRDLAEAGADVNARDERGRTPLHYAAENGHQETAMALVELGAKLYAKDRQGCTALHYAAKNGHNDTAGALARAGADTGIRDKAGQTPVECAIAGGHQATAQAITDLHGEQRAGDDGAHSRGPAISMGRVFKS